MRFLLCIFETDDNTNIPLVLLYYYYYYHPVLHKRFITSVTKMMKFNKYRILKFKKGCSF